jgi:DNA-binding protein Fis
MQKLAEVAGRVRIPSLAPTFQPLFPAFFLDFCRSRASSSALGYISDLLDRAERGEVSNAFSKMLEDLEPELYAQAIKRAAGNQTKAADWLAVTRLKMREN